MRSLSALIARIRNLRRSNEMACLRMRHGDAADMLAERARREQDFDPERVSRYLKRVAGGSAIDRERALGYLWLCLFLVGLGFAVIAPYRALSHEHEIRRLGGQIARDRTRLRQRESIERGLADMKDRWQGSSYILQADNENLATIELHRRIKEAANATIPRERRCRGISINTGRGPDDLPGESRVIRPVHLEIRMTCGIQGIRDVVTALEHDIPRVMIERFDVRRGNRSELRGKVMPAALDVDMMVTGFIVTGTQAAGDSTGGGEQGA